VICIDSHRNLKIGKIFKIKFVGLVVANSRILFGKDCLFLCFPLGLNEVSHILRWNFDFFVVLVKIYLWLWKLVQLLDLIDTLFGTLGLLTYFKGRYDIGTYLGPELGVYTEG